MKEPALEHHHSFRAMDTDIDIFIESETPTPTSAFVSARLLFEQQEERFSRFRERTTSIIAMTIDPMVLDRSGNDRCVLERDVCGDLPHQRRVRIDRLHQLE